MPKTLIVAFLVIAAGCADLTPLEARIEDLQSQVNGLLPLRVDLFSGTRRVEGICADGLAWAEASRILFVRHVFTGSA
jgi:hypothetical protein